jgi:hypothetical protein
MRLPSRVIVTITAGALAVAGGSTLADAHDGPGHGVGGDEHGKRHARDDRGTTRATRSCARRCSAGIDGLVFAEGANVGKNTVPQLAATVYCGGTAVGTTKPVAFSPEGDARIDETVATAPPSPCLAPALLINPAPSGTPAAAVYIAASGA